MSSDQLTPVARRWLRDTEATPPDARGSARQVAARTPYVRQRGRWWALPRSGRWVSPAPSPITNDLTPAATGGTRLMFSPVKAIAAGALVFALAGVFLSAQPFQQGGSVPGAEHETELTAPVYVNTTGAAAVSCDEGSEVSEADGPISRTLGMTCTVRHQWSDSRLQGEETYTVNGVDYLDESELYVGHYTHDIVTDEGAWRMRPLFRFDSSPADGEEVSNFAGTFVLDGEGAYEGLSAVLDKNGPEPLRGFIVSTDLLPPAPEGVSTK